ncbi:MAG TPA: divalent-cation tolerance protein CutA [Caulobacterales bacterium]|jgi:periplasmic divalent cation tolerance protein|nr:divalent-cation tolerance protein CutA [Caulobacterales bacterium]
MTACLIYSTWPDAGSAQACAAQLIDAQVAACVTVLPVAHSTFRWGGKVQQTQEAVMLVKTDKTRAGPAREALLAAHPYDLPCILAFDVNDEGSNTEFLQWIATETTPAG